MKKCAIIGLENWIWDFPRQMITERKITLRFEVLLENLILKGCQHFMLGNRGFVDKIAVKVLEKLKKTYPQIVVEIFEKIKYFPNIKDYVDDEFAKEIDFESYHKVYTDKIFEINKQMMEKSDFIVHCFVEKGIEMSEYVYDYVFKNEKPHFCIDWF